MTFTLTATSLLKIVTGLLLALVFKIAFEEKLKKWLSSRERTTLIILFALLVIAWSLSGDLKKEQAAANNISQDSSATVESTTSSHNPDSQTQAGTSDSSSNTSEPADSNETIRKHNDSSITEYPNKENSIVPSAKPTIVFPDTLEEREKKTEVKPKTIIKETIYVRVKETFYSDIERGDSISIKAGGEICLGPLAGCWGTDGRPDHKYDSKSFFPQAHHGSLLVRLGDSSWHYYTTSHDKVATHSGNLQFLVNDRDNWNNSGEFEV